MVLIVVVKRCRFGGGGGDGDKWVWYRNYGRVLYIVMMMVERDKHGVTLMEETCVVGGMAEMYGCGSGKRQVL